MTSIRPVYGDPDTSHEDELDENGTPHPYVGWDLSFGCRITFNAEENGFTVTVNTSDKDKRDGITYRSVTREQIADHARQLLALAGADSTAVDIHESDTPEGRAQVEKVARAIDRSRIPRMPSAQSYRDARAALDALAGGAR